MNKKHDAVRTGSTTKRRSRKHDFADVERSILSYRCGARAIAITKGEYKTKVGEPKIWFTSMKSVAEVLSDQNRALLKVIRETNPDSMAVLAKATGRQPGNLSRTLKTMSRYGLVDLRREKSHVRPVVTATGFRILAAA